MIEIVLNGCPRSKKNSMQIIALGGRPRLIPSKWYREFEKIQLTHILQEQKLGINYPINLQCLYYMETRRRVDLCNLLEATCDILVKGGVLADDNSRIVVSHDGSKVLYDKANPRTIIRISPATEEV